MNRITFGYTGADAFWLLVGEWLIWSLPHAVALALAHRALRGRALVCLWLPAAWALAELARFHILSLALDDWLATQWTVGPVLRALRHLGWYPTLLACLVAAASLGEAVTTYLPRVALPALLVPAALLAMPPLAPHTDRLAGVLAVHTDSLAALPHTPPPGAARPRRVARGALGVRPLLAEGVTRSARVQPPLPGSPATHVVGALSQRPFGGRQNQVLIVAADGAVAASRAKSLLFPIGERRILGIGADAFVPGRVAPALDAGGVSVIPLICGEVMSRALVRRGVDAGGQLLVVPSRDQMMVGDRPLRQLLAIQVLRSVELGVPSARSSYGSAASLVAADGAVLAVSGRDRSGFLSWDPVGGPRGVDFWGDPSRPARPRPRARAPTSSCSTSAPRAPSARAAPTDAAPTTPSTTSAAPRTPTPAP
ncbi:MAG: hypothetical protein H6745_33705 [Deltaproteobacteria bacterium]|nr:hypothetical protein [Deltaproteobacteria bacterium]